MATKVFVCKMCTNEVSDKPYFFDHELCKDCLKKAKDYQPEPTQYKWQYFDSTWNDYDKEASDEIDAMYKTYTYNPSQNDVRSVMSGGKFHYFVNFIDMKQTNIDHHNHKQRDIRRVVAL